MDRGQRSKNKTKFIAMSAFHHARYVFGMHVLVLVPFINRHSIEQNMHTHRGWQRTGLGGGQKGERATRRHRGDSGREKRAKCMPPYIV